jgi:hypothetical protein
MMESILHALNMAFAMGWEILWPLILGFHIVGCRASGGFPSGNGSAAAE